MRAQARTQGAAVHQEMMRQAAIEASLVPGEASFLILPHRGMWHEPTRMTAFAGTSYGRKGGGGDESG